MVSKTKEAENKALKAEATKLAKAQRFIEGEHVGLRAAMEEDLGRLAQLMAESPLVETNPQPWTEQKLKKLFEDKDDPGLWSEDKKRYYLAVDKAGELVGFLIQSRHFDGCYNLSLHVANDLADRDEVGKDMVKAYMDLSLDWTDPNRIEGYILQLEEGKASWFEANGFEMECTFEKMYMYQGEAVSATIWGWVNPRNLD